MVLVLSAAAALALSGCGGSGSTSTTAAETEAAETEAAEEETVEAEEEEDEEDEEELIDEADEELEVLSYSEYMDALIDDEVTIEAYVQAKQALTEEDEVSVYAQDLDGGYFIYNMACAEDEYDLLQPGTKIQVNGYKAEWSGEIEIVDAVFKVLDGEDTYIADAMDVTDLLGTDDLIDYQNQFVAFTGMTVEAAGQDDDGEDVAFLYNWDGSGSEGDDLYFNVSYNGESYTFTVESNLCDSSTDVYTAVQNLEIGQTIDLEGFLYWYEGVNPHITSVTVVD